MRVFFTLLGVSMMMAHAGSSAQSPKYGSGACPNKAADWNHLGPTPFDGHQFNVLGVDDVGRKTWNGKPVSDDEWMRYLRMVGEVYMGPLTILRPSASTACEEVIRLRRIMTDLLDCEEQCKEGPKFDRLTIP